MLGAVSWKAKGQQQLQVLLAAQLAGPPGSLPRIRLALCDSWLPCRLAASSQRCQIGWHSGQPLWSYQAIRSGASGFPTAGPAESATWLGMLDVHVSQHCY
jgi:hypothetical protein